MINSTDFANRLQKVMDYYGETASFFAEKIGVQRSSISHILSGRNKPSLDFVLKVLTSYPDVELYWLLNGKGTFPKSETVSDTSSVPKSLETPIQKISNKDNKPKEIERIVIFYSDGSFENFEK
ncbi:helix-turn-helix domain-containing protein [Hyunsoonleella rubra]|uniref:Helix-turn-helix domain-containing protein n=1 Tax=Hyunsoonleella rubra TaxID=1737062 RepID=A0ABW5T9N0_9FLAO